MTSHQSENDLPQAYAITDGRDGVGTVERRDGYYVAVDVDGVIIGKFHDLKVAVRSLPDGRVR
jgi:hypothetical protein